MSLTFTGMQQCKAGMQKSAAFLHGANFIHLLLKFSASCGYFVIILYNMYVRLFGHVVIYI